MSKTHYIIPFFIPNIGCPHDCVFCSQSRITGKESPVSPEEILPTIREYRTTFPQGVSGVEAAFFGGSFTGIPAPLQAAYLEKAFYAKKTGFIERIRLSTRPDYIDEEVLVRLKDYGVDTIELGVQSMSGEVLKKSARGHTPEDVVRASNMIRAFGFSLGLQMMIGLPGSNRDTEVETAVRICALKPDFVRIYPSLVIKGTALETMYKKGLYRPLTLEEAVDTCAVLTEMFIRQNIDIIRIGLQPTDIINEGGEVAAGPFHPSFRQLVDSRIMLKTLKKVLAQRGIDPKFGLAISVNPKSLSTLQGIRKENITALSKEYPGLEVKISQDKNLGETEVHIKNGMKSFAVDYRQVIIKS
jgi:histone acetyltransferase (RNA polymerase elongator complex component)